MNIPVVWSSQERQHPKQIEGTKKVALYNINRFKNDEYISNLTDFFKFDLYKLLNSDGSF